MYPGRPVAGGAVKAGVLVHGLFLQMSLSKLSQNFSFWESYPEFT
jgi:predicted solute-binding protein